MRSAVLSPLPDVRFKAMQDFIALSAGECVSASRINSVCFVPSVDANDFMAGNNEHYTDDLHHARITTAATCTLNAEQAVEMLLAKCLPRYVLPQQNKQFLRYFYRNFKHVYTICIKCAQNRELKGRLTNRRSGVFQTLITPTRWILQSHFVSASPSISAAVRAHSYQHPTRPATN
jgi:hypothetical protein